MSILYSLLCKGYFPKEIPPAFNTKSFAGFVTHEDFVPDDCLKAPNNSGALTDAKNGVSKSCRHNLGMRDRTSRPIHIPHPAHYFYLCQTIDQGWSDLQNHLNKSKLSISTPQFDDKYSRAFVPKHTGKERVDRRIGDRGQGDYLIVADIANCYGSIYTHSIPWALHTKPVAKASRRDSNLIGNQLDTYIRNGQDGQTVGIPVGSDTSFLMAEIVLCAVDEVLQKKHPNLTAFRFYDDYEIVCSNEIEAQQMLASLEESLSEYELSLNRRKTRIVPLPDHLDYPWLSEIRKFDLETDKSPFSEQRLVDFANVVFGLAKSYPDNPILRYALAILASSDIHCRWKTYQNLLVQIYRTEPQVSNLIAHQLLYYSETHHDEIDKELLGQAVSDHILRYALTRATNEIAWALWLAILFDLRLNREASRKIAVSNDNIVAILAIDANNRGIFQEPIDTSLWEDALNETSIYSEDWLLAYEVPSQGWKEKDSSNYINQHPCFGELHEANVRFYDTDSYQQTDELLKQLKINPDFYTA
jgi:hypothetical protein